MLAIERLLKKHPRSHFEIFRVEMSRGKFQYEVRLAAGGGFLGGGIGRTLSAAVKNFKKY